MTVEEHTLPTMHEHPELSATLLVNTGPVPEFIRDAIRYHHERRDGTGYPFGLSGDAIPTSALILGAADALAHEFASGRNIDPRHLIRWFGPSVARAAMKAIQLSSSSESITTP